MVSRLFYLQRAQPGRTCYAATNALMLEMIEAISGLLIGAVFALPFVLIFWIVVKLIAKLHLRLGITVYNSRANQ